MKSENLSNILKSRGFKNIELDSIIETKHILKRSGGNFRQYLFSFYDQNFTEYALRSDLSIASVLKFIKDKNQKKLNGLTVERLTENKIKITNHLLLNKLVLRYLVVQIIKKKTIMKSLKHLWIYLKNQSLRDVN